jgi:ribose transport system substrate-binding protein
LGGGGILKKKWIVPLVFTVFLIGSISIVVRFLKEDNKPKVIIVVQRLDLEYWKIFESGAKKAFHDFDIDGKVLAPNSIYPISNQLNMLKKVLNQQPDALIVALTFIQMEALSA